MAVTLTTNAKNWIARNLGIGDCMTETSQAFTYRDSVNSIDIADSGGTATIVNRLIDSLVPYVTIGGTQYTYAALKTQNNNVELVYPDDVQWVMAHDAGDDQYCYKATQICVPGTKRCKTSSVIEECNSDGSGWDDVQTCGTGYTCQNGVCVAVTPPPSTEHSETPPLQVTIAEGTQCQKGAPKVILDVTDARPYFKVDPLLYVGVMGINVTNVNQGGECFGYFVWEMRMWKGEAGDTCPATDPDVQTISRFLGKKSDYKTISPQLLGTDETDMIGGAFEIPPGTHGVYTLCLSLWGNHDKQALLDELAGQNYPENIRWV